MCQFVSPKSGRVEHEHVRLPTFGCVILYYVDTLKHKVARSQLSLLLLFLLLFLLLLLLLLLPFLLLLLQASSKMKGTYTSSQPKSVESCW